MGYRYCMKRRVFDLAATGGRNERLSKPMPRKASCAMRREYPSISDFGNGAVGRGNVSVDTYAWQKAIDWAVTQKAFVTLPALDLLLAEGAPPITCAAAVIGVSPMCSRIFLQPEFTGAVLTVRNAGFGGESTCYPVNGHTAFANSVDDLLAGVAVRNLSIIGNRSQNRLQTGLLIEGNVDHLILQDLFLGYLNGSAIRAGASVGDRRGQLRESSFSRIWVRHCGRVDSTASIAFHHSNVSPSHPTADSSNLLTLDDIHVVFPFGRGIEFVESGGNCLSGALYGVIGKKIMLHGRHVRDGRSNGALLHLEGALKNLKLEVNFAFSDKGDVACRIISNPTTGGYPTDITLDAMLGDVWSGIEIQNGENINWNVEQNSFVRREMMTVYEGLRGPVNVRCTGDISFLRLPDDIVLNGLDPVPVEGLHPGMGALAFMAIDADGGHGDSMRVEAGGITGTLTRVRATCGALEHHYRFTPDKVHYETIRAGTYLSKFVIGATQWPRFSGRFRFTPMERRPAD